MFSDRIRGGRQDLVVIAVQVALRSGRAEIRHRALINAMRIDADPALAACRNASVSRTTVHRAR